MKLDPFSTPVMFSSNCPIDTVIRILNENMIEEFRVFESRMFRGTLLNQELNASIIGPNYGIIFTINSIVQGFISSADKATELNLRVKFGIGMYIILGLFPVLPFMVSLNAENKDISTLIVFSAISGLFMYVAMRAKLNWDKRRLLAFLNDKMKS